MEKDDEFVDILVSTWLPPSYLRIGEPHEKPRLIRARKDLNDITDRSRVIVVE